MMLVSTSQAATIGAAGKLVKRLTGKRRKAKRQTKTQATVIALFGDLGSGKTTFTKGLGLALGVRRVHSPTFVIERRHRIPDAKNLPWRNFIHWDGYRLASPKEALSIGWQERINDSSNIVAVEWAERLEGLLPRNTFRVYFKFAGNNNHRHIRLP